MEKREKKKQYISFKLLDSAGYLKEITDKRLFLEPNMR